MSTKTPKRKFSRKREVGVTSIPNDEELSHLEKIVLKTGSEIFEEVQSEEDTNDETPSKIKRLETEKKPAWVDEDDNVTFEEVVIKQKRRITLGANKTKNYKEITEQKYQQVMGVHKWSKKRKNNDNPAEDLLKTCGKLINKPKFLDKDVLEYKSLKNLNFETHSEGPYINVVKFHPKSMVAMVAGISGMVSLFQVDGKENPKLQSIQFHKFPIHCGSFLRNGEELLVGSHLFKYFYSYNLMTGKSSRVMNSTLTGVKNTKIFRVSPNDDFIALCGNSGSIFLFAASTKEYIDSFQMNCEVTSLNFNHDGSLLYSHGEDGEVYIWDMKTRTCIKKFYDEGSLTGTSICCSNNDEFIACGSSSGVVNIYDAESVKSENVSLPMKTVYNLLTPITSLQFNPTSELLVMASNAKNNALKLIHCPSMTVYCNFPHLKSRMKKPLCVDFSPNSGFLGVGDSSGSAHLFRLKYYGNY